MKIFLFLQEKPLNMKLIDIGSLIFATNSSFFQPRHFLAKQLNLKPYFDGLVLNCF